MKIQNLLFTILLLANGLHLTIIGIANIRYGKEYLDAFNIATRAIQRFLN